MIPRNTLPWSRHLSRSTPWHRTDPRVRLLVSLVLSGLALASRSWKELLVAYLFLALLYLLSRTEWRTAWAGFRPFFFLLLFTVLLQLLFTPGRPVAGTGALPFSLTHEGVSLSLAIFLRLSAIILVSSHLIATTSPFDLSRSLGWAFSPGARAGLPVADLVLLLNIGFQFFPIIMEESQNLRLALESRGISLRHPRIFMRLRALTAWIMALLSAILERSHRLALALELKGFGREGLLRLRFPPWRTESTAALTTLGTFTLLWFYIRLQ